MWAECRAVSVSLDDWGSIAVLERASATAYLEEGRITDALPLFHSAAATFRHKGETSHLIETLFHLGRAQKEGGDPDGAQNTWKEALHLARQYGDAGRVELLNSVLVPGESQK